jgi:hypothetical protein
VFVAWSNQKICHVFSSILWPIRVALIFVDERLVGFGYFDKRAYEYLIMGMLNYLSLEKVNSPISTCCFLAKSIYY